MGPILSALMNVIAKNPALLESLLEAGAQLLVAELQKAAAAVKQA